MCPSFHERRGRKQHRLPHLRIDLPQVLEMEEVPRVDLVDRDVPQRRQVEVAHVLFLPIRGPFAIDVRQVVERAARLALERARASTCLQTPSDRTRATARPRPAPIRGSIRWPGAEGTSRAPSPAPGRRAPAVQARDAVPWPAATRSIGSPPFMRPATVRNSSCTSCSSRSAMDSSRSALSEMPSSSFSLRSKFSRPRRNDALARGARSVSR